MAHRSEIELPTATKEERNAAYSKLVSEVRQGDLISLGAVNLVGIGTSAAWSSAAEHEGVTEKLGEELWSLIIESEVGWYVILTQDCDIVRSPDVEPTLVVCPLRYVPNKIWQALRSGPRSPREFPFPNNRGLPEKGGYKPVADLRFITSVDKTAIAHRSVKIRRPLSASQRATFSNWVGQRYARTPHPDALEQDVLPKVAGLIRKLAMKPNPESDPNPEVRLVAASESWYLGGNEKRVVFHMMISEASARKAGLWDEAESDFQDETLKAAQKKLLGKMRASLDSGSGSQIELKVGTLHGVSAADLLEWDEWIVEDPSDPLAE